MNFINIFCSSGQTRARKILSERKSEENQQKWRHRRKDEAPGDYPTKSYKFLKFVSYIFYIFVTFNQ
jgi:hypothetical protein